VKERLYEKVKNYQEFKDGDWADLDSDHRVKRKYILNIDGQTMWLLPEARFVKAVTPLGLSASLGPLNTLILLSLAKNIAPLSSASVKRSLSTRVVLYF
jgi:hypothetical protein